MALFTQMSGSNPAPQNHFLNGIVYTDVWAQPSTSKRFLNGIVYTDAWAQPSTSKPSTAAATSWRWRFQAVVEHHGRHLRTRSRALNATWWLCFQTPPAWRASLSVLNTRFPTATLASCQPLLLLSKAVSKAIVVIAPLPPPPISPSNLSHLPIPAGKSLWEVRKFWNKKSTSRVIINSVNFVMNSNSYFQLVVCSLDLSVYMYSLKFL